MRQPVVILLLLLLSLVACITNADAAAHKKKKKKYPHQHLVQVDGKKETVVVYYTRKEERKWHKQERKRSKRDRKLKKHGYTAESEYVFTQPAKPDAGFKYPPTVMKQRYRVDVLAALYLDELVKKGEVAKDKFPDKALPGISFYEGLSIAADSLKKAGFSIDIYVHDIASAAESPDSLVSKKLLDSSDLIIGALHTYDIPVIASYAKSRKINFVSALSPSDAGVKGNKYFTVIQPTIRSHCDWIVGDLSRNFPGLKVTLLYRKTTEAEEHAWQYLTASGKVAFKQLNCSAMPGKDSLIPLFDSTKPNVVVVSILDPLAADSILCALSADFPGAHFEVYGMPSWGSIADLRKENKFPNLSVNVTSPFFFEVNSPIGKYVMNTCKNNYGTKANEHVYRGFETMFWYANLLRQYGTMFNSNYTDNSAALFTKFEIKQRRDNDGHILFNENTHIFSAKYEGGSVTPIP